MPPRDSVRVAVLAADRRVRSGLASLLAASGEVMVVGSAGDIDGALGVLRSQAPDVVVVDPRFPDGEAGRDVVALLRGQAPTARILVIRWQDGRDEPFLDDAADGALDAALYPSALLDAIAASKTAVTEPAV